MVVQTFLWRFQMQKFEKLRTAISKNMILIKNFTNTTHFTPTNVLESYEHCSQKGSGNHYLKRIISATPFISTQFWTVPLIQNVTMCNIWKSQYLEMLQLLRSVLVELLSVIQLFKHTLNLIKRVSAKTIFWNFSK